MSNSNNNSPPAPIIGIDLGTTYSCLACWNNETQRVEVISSPSGRTMPSWVGFTAQGKIVGSAAKDQAPANPQNTIYDAKRLIGRTFHDSVVQQEIKNNLPFAIIEGPHGEPKIQIHWRNQTKLLSPEEISAMVLAELKLAAEQHLKQPVTQAVITVPAHFNNQQRQATKDAGRIAGLDVRRIINEPTAAALAYGLHNVIPNSSVVQEKTNVVIFDLGGGTFDVSVLLLDNGVFEVKATGGDTHLGGQDFDNNVLQWCFQQMEQIHGATKSSQIQSSPRAISRLRRAVESAKKNLSTTMSTNLEVDSILENLDLNLTLTRAKWEELNADMLNRCMETVKSVLQDANVSLAEVTEVVLVGGSTRVPLLQTRLYELLEKRIALCKSVHPDEAVAIGAAVQGHILAAGGSGGGTDLSTETTTDLLLLDVTPLSLGIELEGRVMSTLIKRNTAIPCKKTRTYTTVDDFQTEIDVVVFEGERNCVDANNKLGSFVISGVQRARAGEPKVDVTFALDANGILNVSAMDQVTNAEAKATIKAEKGRLSSEDIEQMIRDAELYRSQDEDLATKMAYKTSLEEALFTAQSKATDDKDMMELENIMDWLELDSDSATFEEMKSKGRIIEDQYGIIVSS